MTVAHVKDPNKVKAGQAGSRSRWGPPRIVRLDGLHPAVADAVRALVAAGQAQTEKSPTVLETPAGLESEQTSDVRST